MPEPVAIPDDLRDFLSAGKQLEYDGNACEMGRVRLHVVSDLRLRLYPSDLDNFDFGTSFGTSEDPHYREMGCYLVPGISLLAECSGDYDAEGLLLWLPQSQRYGSWDGSHANVRQFGPDITWRKISENPLVYLDAPWSDDNLLIPVIPWPDCRYSAQQLYEPLDS